MGTRNLTVVIKDNKIKLSQYGQWDGYFSCTGVKFLEFVKKNLQAKTKEELKYRLEKFGEKIDVLEDVDVNSFESFIGISDKYGINPNTNSSNYAIPLRVLLPQFSRDTGVEILDVINLLEPYYFEKGGKTKSKFKFPIQIFLDKERFTKFINIINLDTQEIYMLTGHGFKGEPLKTCELVENTFWQKCWFKSSIAKLPRISDIEKYKNSIELDYWTDEHGVIVAF